MARINVETDLWADPRFQELLIRAGDRHKAKGMVLELFTVAQKHWYPDRKLIPIEEIGRAGLEALIDVGLAEIQPHGVYCRGSEEAFAWLFEKQEAGKKSAEVRRAKFGTAQPGKARVSRRKKTSPNTVRTMFDDDRTLFNTARTVPNSPEALTPSPSLNPSPDPSPNPTQNHEVYSVGGESAEADVTEIKNPVGYFIGVYRNAYRRQYGEDANPDVRGKVQGQIKALLKDVPLQRACQLIQTFCGMNDRWFLTKGHDFGTFIENLSKVGLYLDTGRATTSDEAKHAESRDFYQNQMDRVLRGEI